LRIFGTKSFIRFARRERITDHALCEADRRAERGLIDADLGGGVIKQRVARPGRGRSGGFRVLAAYRAKSRSVFIFGFAKNERDNIGDEELATLRDVGRAFLTADDAELARALAAQVIQEIPYGEEDED
jgi:hypothetical protein